MYVMSRYWRCVFCGLGFKLEVMDAIITRCLHTYNLLCAKYHFEKENICLHCKSTVGAEWYLTWGLKVHSYGMWLRTYLIFILCFYNFNIWFWSYTHEYYYLNIIFTWFNTNITDYIVFLGDQLTMWILFSTEALKCLVV